MNRRQFVKDTLATSLGGVAGGSLLASEASTRRGAKELTAAPPEPAGAHRVYTHLLDPREHPDYSRRHVRPPSWDTFEGRTRLTTLRGFKIEDGRIVNYAEELEKYTKKFELGEVIWPMYPILFTENLGDLADEIKRQKLFLFDIWGYVPGSGPGGVWQQYQAPAGVFELLEAKLGERWLGADNGEQDGRYIGGYASQFYPTSSDRLEQYLNFQRHFERLTFELGNKLSTLVSLNFGHYFLKEGVYTLIGAETAQALPNGQIYYAFIRGAGKQYGVPWFGNASVWNRWGWKQYGAEQHDGGVTGGPTHGTSLSLLKRLLYSHILYNSMLVGFESSWFYPPREEELSPVGLIQRAAGRWMREVGAPGAMLTPIALMLDFFAGWTFPRHLYTPEVYRVWGNLPYGPGDYLADGVLDMLYPGYQDSSFYHDESGFLSATPYGDSADCLLSDAPDWLLDRYPVLVVAGELGGGAEIRDRLDSYVKRGGHLLLTAGNLAKLPGGLAGIEAKAEVKRLETGAGVQVGRTRIIEDSPFDLCQLSFPKIARVRAEAAGVPAVVEMAYGEGRLTVLGSLFGVGAVRAHEGEILNEVDKPLAQPFPLLKHVRSVLDEAFRGQVLIEAGEGLSLITCRKGPGEYTLGIANHTWRQQPLKIASRCGRLESVRELTLDQSEKGAVGYLPLGSEKMSLGVSDDGHIAGGDVRIFAVRVQEDSLTEIAHVAPPARPRGRLLPLRGLGPLREAVWGRPSFFAHFDGVVIDWRYLQVREREELAQEAGWVGQQGLSVVVDLTSGINLFPDLRLLNNLRQDHAASLAAIEDVIAKMEILPARDLVMSLHRYPETNFSEEQAWQSFEATLRQVSERARRREVTVHLRLSLNKPPEDVKKAVEFAGRVGAPNLRLAPSTAFLLASKAGLDENLALLKGQVGLWLVSSSQTDVAGRVWTANGPVRACQDGRALARILAIAPEAPLLFDVPYASPDEAYLDAKYVREITRAHPSP